MSAATVGALAQRADQMLRQMTWHGDPVVGARILAQHPDLATFDFITAVATGHLEAVQRGLAADPAAATRPGGPYGWQPLLYLAYSRLAASDAPTVAIARLLLDHGADINARWVDDWNNPFTLITGVIAEGEGLKPPHPQARELAALFLQHGADPYDTQALYNNSIASDSTYWLDVLWNACEAQHVTDKWRAVPPASGSANPPVNQLDYLLGNAVTHHQPLRATWLLEHGASPDCTHVYTGRPLPELALLHNATAVAAVLRRFGASDRPPPPKVALHLACRQHDFAAARAIISRSPELAHDPETLQLAAGANSIELIDLLLDLGQPVDAMNAEGVRALHAAVAHDAHDAALHLVKRGALVDTPTRHYGGAMGTAAHFGHRECAALLAPHSRDVHNMVSLELKERLATLFAAEPALVNQPHFRRGTTPLFWLPQDDAAALDMARFLLAHGADARTRNAEGKSAGELAALQGRQALAQLLGS